MAGLIASILHRETIAVIVGKHMFERGERCFAEGRVERVDRSDGELRGIVRPQEVGRRSYDTRIWVHETGLAYRCTCPVGRSLSFCKHTVAISLAHLENERIAVERHITLLREALTTISQPALVDGLLALAHRDHDWSVELKKLCLDALSRQ